MGQNSTNRDCGIKNNYLHKVTCEYGQWFPVLLCMVFKLFDPSLHLNVEEANIHIRFLISAGLPSGDVSCVIDNAW